MMFALFSALPYPLLAAFQGGSSDRENALLLVFIVTAAFLLFIGYHFYWRKRTQRLMEEKNEQLRTALSMAEEAEKMKREFIRSVSHEMRTPLNVIKGFNDILNNRDIEVTPIERTNMLERINENVKAFTKIIDELIEMAEQGSSEYYPRTGQIFLNQFCAGVVRKMQSELTAKQTLTFSTEIDNHLTLKTNKEGVAKVLENLIENAIKFTPAGHIVVDCISPETSAYVLLRVTDDGKGIPEELRSGIFEGFNKVDSFKQGIGLGLAVSRKIAQKLGGDLTLDGEYQNGSRFVFTLPKN